MGSDDSDLGDSVKVLTTTEALMAELEDLASWAEELFLAYAWMSSQRARAPHWQVLTRQKRKLRQVVSGIQFAQTEPAVLRALASLPNVLRVVEDTVGVFHPKVLVGVCDGGARAIVGSSNFTSKGFGGNTEINLALSGPKGQAPLAELLAFVEQQWLGPRAFVPDDEWLMRYEEAYNARPHPPRVRSSAAAPISIQTAADLDLVWADYYQLIAGQERRLLANAGEIHVFDHPDGSFLQEVDACQRAFQAYPRFSEMPEAARKLIGGWGPDTTGYFGRMTGAGRFKQLVRAEPDKVGAWLDQIPLAGAVSASVIQRVVAGLLSLDGVGVGALSRLLSVKRPDLFLPVNNASRRKIAALFGRAPTTAAGYLQLHEALWSFLWAQSPDPLRAPETAVWKARVALLDALLYEPKSGDLGPQPAASTQET